jgi:hypothetical protein
MRSFMHAAGWAIGTAWLLAAASTVASAGVAGPPVLGYAFEPASRAIRPVIGVAGSAVLDSALASASKIETAFVAPGRQFAIAEMRGGSVSVLRWRNSSVEASEVGGAPETASLAAFSSGEFAAVYSKEAARIQVWRGLPDAPAVAWEVAADDVHALAISADGTRVAAAGPAGITLYGESSARLAAGGEFSAAAFLPGSHEVLAAETDSGRVVSIRGEGNAAEFATNLTEPRSIAVSRDGTTVAVAGGEGQLTLVQIADPASAATIACECKPLAATPVDSDTGFLITASDGSIWVLDLDSGEPRLVFAGGAQ